MGVNDDSLMLETDDNGSSGVEAGSVPIGDGPGNELSVSSVAEKDIDDGVGTVVGSDDGEKEGVTSSKVIDDRDEIDGGRDGGSGTLAGSRRSSPSDSVVMMVGTSDGDGNMLSVSASSGDSSESTNSFSICSSSAMPGSMSYSTSDSNCKDDEAFGVLSSEGISLGSIAVRYSVPGSEGQTSAVMYSDGSDAVAYSVDAASSAVPYSDSEGILGSDSKAVEAGDAAVT